MLRREEPGTVIARRYGVPEASLCRWRDEFLAAGEAALAGGTRKGSTRDRQIVEFEQQIEKRDQVIGELTVANRILKNSRVSLPERGDTYASAVGTAGAVSSNP